MHVTDDICTHDCRVRRKVL